ncbi:MAG: hypothetical protein COZ18_06685 [Flexibacter sp. CG_4_10_14_3_um_filter_32_15]|nr:MAG: hypothetical protein COZ18_06685 [Flexibacter sp. CG_4_10_14_3_um_filter_32_15]
MKNKESKLFNKLAEKITLLYNPELDKYDNVVLFPEKVKKAKEHIAKVGMPKAYYEQLKKSKF